MISSRWWPVAISGATVVCLALLLASPTTPLQLAVGVSSLAAILGGWFVLGRRACTNPRAGIGYSVLLVIATGVGVAAAAPLATVQCIVFPLLWVLATSLRGAIIANLALALSVTMGFLVSLGTSPDAVTQAVVTQTLSLTFSLAFGFWITRIIEAGEERQRLLDELTAAQDRVSELARQSGITQQREHMAREIHDTIAQSLTGLVMLAERARATPELPTKLDGELELIEATARLALAEARGLVAASAPVGLADGLEDALARLADRFERESGITTAVQHEGDTLLDMEGEVVLLRCAQEALANIRKHAGAQRVTLVLRRVDENVELVVQDDGVGMDTSTASTGFGIAGMRERLALAGGDLDICSPDTGGTVLLARLAVAR